MLLSDSKKSLNQHWDIFTLKISINIDVRHWKWTNKKRAIIYSVDYCDLIQLYEHFVHVLSTLAHKTFSLLKVLSYAFLVITRPLVCYVSFSACKRSAESQTLKVHPVGSKTLTQKIPVSAAALYGSCQPTRPAQLCVCVLRLSSSVSRCLADPMPSSCSV